VDFRDKGGDTGTMGLATVTGICTRNNGCVIGELGMHVLESEFAKRVRKASSQSEFAKRVRKASSQSEFAKRVSKESSQSEFAK
jgi:hypothetical protein